MEKEHNSHLASGLPYWQYWLEAAETGFLPDRPIPQIDWLDSPNQRTRKMLETTLNAIPKHGSWQSMGGWEYFRYLLAWMLWGFGHPGYGEPVEPPGCEGASMRVYQTLNICAWMLWPYDLLGDFLAENAYGKGQGFFPTPMPVCAMLTSMLMGSEEEDMRYKTVCDPAVGTGRFLLAASNYSLRLSGQDIDPLMCQATLVNGFLFAPWLAKPLPFIDSAQPDQHGRSDAILAPALPQAGAQPGETASDGGEELRFDLVQNRGARRMVAEANSGEVQVQQGRLF